MGSSLSPVVADFFMEAFKTSALQSAPLKPSFYWRDVDDTFLMWSHGETKLQEFVGFLNSSHQSIQCTVEVEQNGCLSFGDVLICRKSDGRDIDRKPTNTKLHLHKDIQPRNNTFCIPLCIELELWLTLSI